MRFTFRYFTYTESGNTSGHSTMLKHLAASPDESFSFFRFFSGKTTDVARQKGAVNLITT